MSQQRQQVYCSLVRSVLEYAAAAFANLTNYKANDFKKIQKRPLHYLSLYFIRRRTG